MTKTETATVEAPKKKKGPPPPLWFTTEYADTWAAGSAHMFILSGDIHGHTVDGRSQKLALESAFVDSKDIIMTFNPATGFSFGPPSLARAMREYAIKLATMQQKRPADEDAVDAAIDAGMGSSGEGDGDPFAEPMGTLDALRLIERMLRNGTELVTNPNNPEGKKVRKGRLAVIIESAELICPQTEAKGMMSGPDRMVLGLLSSWGRDKSLSQTNNPIFLICGTLDELHQDLRSKASGMKVIEIPLPDVQDRLAYLKRYLAKRESDGKAIKLLDLTVEELARSTAGLNLRHLEDILLLAFRLGGITRQLVRARKDEIIKTEFSSSAEMIDALPEGLAALGGSEHLIRWMEAEIINPVRQGRWSDVSDHNLLVGPPGTGKTFLVRALAGELNLPAVALNFENILGKYVGESEGKLKQFFGFAKALAPCVVFFDEPDQSPGTNRGQAGDPVGGSLFGQVLRFMGEDNGQVIFMFASNRPDKMDSALLRSGRMKAIVPVLLPNGPARQGILKAQARRQGIAISEQAIVLGGGVRTKDFSAADLEAVISKARKLARRDERTEITVEDMERALGYIKPNTPQIAQKYTLLAIKACNDSELIPDEYKDKLSNRKALDAEIREAEEDDTEDRDERIF